MLLAPSAPGEDTPFERNEGMRRDWQDAPSVLRTPVLSVCKWDERHCAKAGSVEGGLHPEAFGGAKEGLT